MKLITFMFSILLVSFSVQTMHRSHSDTDLSFAHKNEQKIDSDQIVQQLKQLQQSIRELKLELDAKNKFNVGYLNEVLVLDPDPQFHLLNIKKLNQYLTHYKRIIRSLNLNLNGINPNNRSVIECEKGVVVKDILKLPLTPRRSSMISNRLVRGY